MAEPWVDIPDLVVRTYRQDDQPAVWHLYHHGLLAGQIAANDTAADIEMLQHAYFSNPKSHFWIAEVQGRILGMIGVAWEDDNTAEIRRLRVDKEHQQTNIGAKLIEAALYHCKYHRYLKIVLDTRFERDAVIDLFDRYGFQHNRTKNVQGKEMLEFYLDLYRKDKHE